MGSNPTSSENKLKMFFQLQILSKDKKVLETFINFFQNLQKTFSTWKVVFNSKKRDVVTVLKSPHVNKTAQEQFEYRIYSKKIMINSFKPSIFLLVLKKIKSFSFPGISLKVTGVCNKSDKLAKTLNLLDPKNFYLSNDSKRFSKYIQLFDCQGETLLKTKYFCKIK